MRDLSSVNCRLVITGTVDGPDELKCEYRVADGKMVETPLSHKPANQNLNRNLNAVWATLAAEIRGIEEI